jgi:aarF domain-containing kinase
MMSRSLVAGRRLIHSRPSKLSTRYAKDGKWAEEISSFRLSRPFAYSAAPLLDSCFNSYQQFANPRKSMDGIAPLVSMLACSSHVVANRGPLVYLEQAADWVKRLVKRYWDYLLVILRGTEIVLILSPMVLLTPAAVFADRFLHTSAVSNLSWGYLIESVQFLGPAFVKLCQWAATRRDIFPPHICDRLAQLQADGIPHSWVHTDQSLRDAFGDYQAKGLSVQPHDIVGCGSAAQVYAGTLTTVNKHGKLEEKAVAIKVLHPNFQQNIDRDIWFLQAIADSINAVPLEAAKVLNLPAAASTFGSILHKQADLRIEADNLMRFRANFYKSEHDERNSAIFFPCPMAKWVTDRVMVEDLVDDGVPIAHYMRDDSTAGKAIRKELAGPLLRAFLKMVFVDNWIHCDIHP